MTRRRALPPDTDIFAFLKALPAQDRARAVGLLGEDDRQALLGAWDEWAHPGQLPPHDDWSTWVIKAGRGFGKTLAGAQWVSARIAQGPPLRIALVGATFADARAVMVEGKSGLLEVAEPWIDEWLPTRRQLRFRNGSMAMLYSGATPHLLRGPEHHYAWCDELAKWKRPQDCWDMLQLGLRLGERPRAIVTTTPQPGRVLRAIMEAPDTVVTGGTTHDNPHLSAGWRARVEAMYGGTRLGRQEIHGELLPDAVGALWSVELIERCRIDPPRNAEGGYNRTLIAVDPPIGDGTCGIVACARDREGLAHVLADHSVTGRSPEGWARAVAAAGAAHRTGEVVAEANQGGRMVKAVLLAADPALRVRLLDARHGKSLRAEPVAHLCEAGRVFFHGRMTQLEAELAGMIAGGGYEGPGRSPDRADAMVWGVTELMRKQAMPRISLG